MEKLIITPKTKVSELLDAYPQLEEKLIEMAPQFKKLKNPVLRKTIARVTTLSQAAIVGGIKVEALVNSLRSLTGQDIENFEDQQKKMYNYEKPNWYIVNKIVKRIDAKEMLNKGEHPVHEVMATIKGLNEDEILEVVFPFLPAPLIDKTLSVGHKNWITPIENNEYKIYFLKNNKTS